MTGKAVDQVDFAILFQKHAAGLRRFLISRGIEADAAADLSQEAFIRILGRSPSGGIANHKGYLFRIAANLGVDLLRQQARPGVVESIDAKAMEIADDRPSAERVVMSRQEIAILAAAFEEVPPMPQKVFLSRLDGMTFAEIERRHGVALKTAFSQVMKVTLFLRSRLDTAQEVPRPASERQQR